MNTLTVAVFIVAVAYASAGYVGLEDPIDAARSQLEGALGGQWIPDVPTANVVAAPALAAPYAAPALAAPYAAPFAAHYAAPYAAAAYAAPLAAAPVAYGVPKGALEGALGGQWINDVKAY